MMVVAYFEVIPIVTTSKLSLEEEVHVLVQVTFKAVGVLKQLRVMEVGYAHVLGVAAHVDN